MILSATLFLLAVICYSIKELQTFGKLKWMDESKPYSFWGEKSHTRKYVWEKDPISGKYPMFVAVPNNWYYRFFKIPYHEKWFTSATLTVALTDGAHLCQFIFKLLFCFAFYPLTNWWFPVILWIVWGVTFTLCDKYLTK